jgi:hypothetical protein
MVGKITVGLAAAAAIAGASIVSAESTTGEFVQSYRPCGWTKSPVDCRRACGLVRGGAALKHEIKAPCHTAMGRSLTKSPERPSPMMARQSDAPLPSAARAATYRACLCSG